MPNVISFSDFNKNQSDIIDELHRTQEPLYLTKNGRNALVVMDAEAFDRAVSFANDIHAKEMRIYDKLLSGYENYRQGKVHSANEADELIRNAKGWA